MPRMPLVVYIALLAISPVEGRARLFNKPDMSFAVAAGSSATFMMYVPPDCDTDSCAKMREFWDLLAKHRNCGCVWLLVCGHPRHARAAPLCKQAQDAGGLIPGGPLVMMWDGVQWDAYRGEKSPQKLLERVDEILKHRAEPAGGREYLVKWRGWKRSASDWVSGTELSRRCSDLTDSYDSRHPVKTRKKSKTIGPHSYGTMALLCACGPRLNAVKMATPMFLRAAWVAQRAAIQKQHRLRSKAL